MVGPSESIRAPMRSRLGRTFFGIGIWSVSRKQGLSWKTCSRIGVPLC